MPRILRNSSLAPRIFINGVVPVTYRETNYRANLPSGGLLLSRIVYTTVPSVFTYSVYETMACSIIYSLIYENDFKNLFVNLSKILRFFTANNNRSILDYLIYRLFFLFLRCASAGPTTLSISSIVCSGARVRDPNPNRDLGCVTRWRSDPS